MTARAAAKQQEETITIRASSVHVWSFILVAVGMVCGGMLHFSGKANQKDVNALQSQVYALSVNIASIQANVKAIAASNRELKKDIKWLIRRSKNGNSSR